MGCTITAVYGDNEDPSLATSADNISAASNDPTTSNEEIYEPELIQQQVEEAQRILHDLDMEMETETEISMKTVRNISDNQLNSAYASSSSSSSSEDIPISKQKDDDYVNDAQLSKEDKQEEDQDQLHLNKSRMGRLLPNPTPGPNSPSPPTHIPDYIRQMKPSDDNDDDNNSQEAANLSLADYTDDTISNNNSEPQHLRSSGQQPSIDYDEPTPQAKENEDIVPLAMRYYDEETNQEVQPQQQWPVPQQRSFALPTNNEASVPPPPPSSAQNSSEEYYDEEVSSREDELMVTTTAAGAAAITPTSQTNSEPRPTMVILAAGFPLAYQPTTSAPAPQRSNNQTPPPAPALMTPASPTLGPTTPPYPLIASAMAAAAAAALPATGDKKGKQIPIVATTTTKTTTTTTTSKTLPPPPPPIVPAIPTTIKTINAVAGTSRRHLLPHEQLRNYIEDAYIRMPLAVIVDPSSESLEKTKALWNEALRANLNIKIILVTLNESDIPAAFNFNNSRQFLTGLNSIKEHEGGDAFRGISHAAELVPYDSAVFISTATLANHTDQVHDAAITLLKKRIRLYLIWFGERSLSENETQETVGGILGEVAIRSGGEVLHIVGNENSMELEGSTLTIVADALRGSQELDVPVDTTLSSLHVKIDKLMRRAVLETPNGG
ncbi:uncharacterized protein LOC133324840 [Musca vetustissima]|uniref:uncharacterized protein LOC133324840 n=1 Tax=Musca vetustissima TaxID=27455 RepID=UPI002AB6381A|nr:uncharacterized protein LOC133324840 [Musca vetustissima]